MSLILLNSQSTWTLHKSSKGGKWNYEIMNYEFVFAWLGSVWTRVRRTLPQNGATPTTESEDWARCLRRQNWRGNFANTWIQKDKIAKFLGVAKARVKHEPQEENKPASSKSAMKKVAIHVKLPKIKLKSFSGNPVEWPSLRDSFQASVDKNFDISGVDKMNYLGGLRSGKSYARFTIEWKQLSKSPRPTRSRSVLDRSKC